MKKQLVRVGNAKIGTSASWTLNDTEIMFTAPDMVSLQWFFRMLDEKLDPAKCRATVTFPADTVLDQLQKKNMEALPAKGSA